MAADADPGNVSSMNGINHPTRSASLKAPIVRSYVQHIEARPEIVFPLICPVREGDWLDGWAETCELVWSASGVAEPGCVFRTIEEGRPETIWIIGRHDPDRGIVQFERVTPGLAASTLRLEVGACDDGTSVVAIRYTVVPTSAEGVDYATTRYDRADLLASIVWWERSMNHYLRTGQLLRRAERGTTTNARGTAPHGTDRE